MSPESPVVLVGATMAVLVAGHWYRTMGGESGLFSVPTVVPTPGQLAPNGQEQPGGTAVWSGVGLLLGSLPGVLAVARGLTAAEASGLALVESVPEPVLVAAVLVVPTAVGIMLFVYLARLSYRVWLWIRGPFVRVWDVLLPGSPVVRFGAGLTVMVVLFLVGPLLVLQTVDLSGGEDPIESPQENASTGQENATAGDDPSGTPETHDEDEPDSPDEPP